MSHMNKPEHHSDAFASFSKKEISKLNISCDLILFFLSKKMLEENMNKGITAFTYARNLNNCVNKGIYICIT